MKKYFFGILAVVFAVGAVAFKTPSRPKANVVFSYQKTTYAQADVQSVASTNWAVGVPSCDATNNAACEIDVDPKYTHTSGGQTVLNDATFPNHITIVATQFGTSGNYFVNSGSSTNIAAVVNKSL